MSGFLAGNQSKLDISRDQLDSNLSTDELGINCPQTIATNPSSSMTRTPKSPWMPFRMLFAAVSNKVPLEVVQIVRTNYRLYMVVLKFKRIAWSLTEFTLFKPCDHGLIERCDDLVDRLG
ncbi:uncharacterized protein LOC130767803 isoform X1 [Actinidia eriantha]|uniref:uncharacterized protein LOC130767803 isoform X1 n=1 Tax=Actinidia eriantha TaxID=165200 RepID=UPI002583FCAC|nr:uncharacterized protein LOC130767803 isoform X1 [Actinidia eriantha]XP_057480803.1 uncharacterized protein LOC130767803 isoform X1 [Actinidia eriantha]